MEACLRTLCDPQEISAELKDLINGMLQCAPHPLHMCVFVCAWLTIPTVRVRSDIIRNARKEFMRKYQSCMFST